MNDFKNPFDPDNFSLGVGWDGKTVTVTRSRFMTDMFTYGDGSPVLDKESGEQAYANVWEITGISEDSEAERSEKYSIGKSLVPTSDGDSFEHRSGKPGATFNQKAKAALFAAALKRSEFDLSKLVSDEGCPSAKGLVGAIFVFKAHQVIGKDGEPVKDKGGFEKVDQLPEKFVGWGKASPQANKVDDAVSNRAYDLITELLTEAEGQTLTRVQLIQALNKKLAGDKDMNTIVGLAVKDSFNSAAPWKVEGTTISLS